LHDIVADKKLSINGLSADSCGIVTPEIWQKAETFWGCQSYEDGMLPRNSAGSVRIRHECGRVDRTKRTGTTDKPSIAGVL